MVGSGSLTSYTVTARQVLKQVLVGHYIWCADSAQQPHCFSDCHYLCIKLTLNITYSAGALVERTKMLMMMAESKVADAVNYSISRFTLRLFTSVLHNDNILFGVYMFRSTTSFPTIHPANHQGRQFSPVPVLLRRQPASRPLLPL